MSRSDNNNDNDSGNDGDHASSSDTGDDHTRDNRNASDNDYDCGRDRHGSGMNIIIPQKTLFKSVELVPMWPVSPSASQCPYVHKVLCRSGVLRGTD